MTAALTASLTRQGSRRAAAPPRRRTGPCSHRYANRYNDHHSNDRYRNDRYRPDQHLTTNT